MKILYYEMRKSWLKIPVLIVLAILAVLNVFRLGKESKMSEITANDYFSVYNDFCGEINDEMINRLQTELDALPPFSMFTVWDREYDKEKYKYTGHQDRDVFSLEDAKDDITYAATYPNTSNKIAERAYENAQFFKALGADYSAKRSALIYRLYRGRNIPEYRYTGWVKHYFTYDFSSLLCIIMLILGLSGTFSSEHESNMNTLISAYGKRITTIGSKILSAAVYSLILTIFFTLLDLLTVMSANRVTGLDMPLYSAEIFSKTPLDITFVQAIALNAFMRFCALFAISMLILFISKITPNTIISECVSFAASAGLIVLSGVKKSVLNPVNMLTPNAYITKFEAVNLFGTPVLTLVAAIAWTLIASLIFGVLIIFVGRRKNV